MKYLITGGCGFLGSNIAAALIKEGEEVTVFDNLSRLGSSKNLEWLKSHGKFKFVHGDVSSWPEVEMLIRDEMPNVIYHLAGQVAMTTSILSPRRDFEINILGSLNILEAVRQYTPNASVIYSSTNKVYGNLEQFQYEETETRYLIKEFPLGIPETVPLEFCSPYGCSKGSADQYMLDYYRVYGVRTAVFRHSSMYGGRQFSTSNQGWVGWFCEQALLQAKFKSTSFTISGNGKQVRDLLYADDMVRLYLSASRNIDIISGEAFNVGGGFENSLSILELLAFLETELKVGLVWEELPVRESDQKVFIADLKKITGLLSWVPVVNKWDGLSRMIDWVSSESLDL